jgi:putative ABC transport system permease protein
VLSDLKYSLRQLRGHPGFTVTVLATFALCIGANALIFAIVHAVLLQPLPFPDSGQLVTTVNSYPKAGVVRIGSSVPNYYDRRDGGIPAFAEVAAIRNSGTTVGEGSGAMRSAEYLVTPSFFRVLEVSAARGRLFLESEGTPGNEHVVVLSDAFWRHHDGSDPAVIGRKLVLDDVPYTIVGVLPRAFDYLGANDGLWVPLAFTPDQRAIRQLHSNSISIIARLKPGATLAQAQEQVDQLNARVEKTDPFAKLVIGAGFRTDVLGLHDNLVAPVRPALLLLQAGVFLLLLIGVVNLFNLFLIRATVRGKEFAVRQALGAGPLDLARQALTETLLLSLVGGGLGAGAGAAGLRVITAWGVRRLPLGADIAVDPAVVAVSLVAAAAVGVVLALPVVTLNRRRDVGKVLNLESRSGTSGRATTRLRHALIAAQVALTFVLLAAAGLLGLSFRRVLDAPAGFREDHVLVGTVALPGKAYHDAGRRFAFAERLLDELKRLPGVSAAGLSTALPATGGTSISATWVEGYNPAPGESLKAHYVYWVAGDYFRALGLTLRAGRFLDASDSRRKEDVCVVDENLARHYWPRESALGHRLTFTPPDMPSRQFYTIVGVVDPVNQRDLADATPTGTIYLPFRPDASPGYLTASVLTPLPPASFAPELRQAVRQIDPELSVGVSTLANRIAAGLSARRATLFLAAIFAGISLALSAVGVYGVLAYTVAQRQREIGVRMALGAVPENILLHFLWLGGRLLLLGAVFGLVGAWFVGRAMSSFLFAVTPFDPLVVGTTVVVLGVVVLLASLIPSLRAAFLSPVEALRDG